MKFRNGKKIKKLVPLWVRNVLSLCNALGGRITSEEIANIAAVAKHYANGPAIVSSLRRNKNVSVEVIGQETGPRGIPIKIYRITRRIV